MRLLRRIAFLVACLALGTIGLPWHTIRPSAPPAFPPSIGAAAVENQQSVTILQRNKFFDPPVVVIHEGDKVVWAMDTRGGWHNVVNYEGDFSAPVMEYSQAFVHTFDRPGVYGYYCMPHAIDGMRGAVVVLPEGAPLPDPVPSPPAVSSWSGTVEPVPYGEPDTIVTVAGGAGTGGLATDAGLYLPEGVAVDDAGRLYIADTENCQIRRVDQDGTMVQVLGHESCGYSLGAEADLGPWLHTNHPRGVALGPDGGIYVADTINCMVRLLKGGVAVTIFGTGSCHASGDGGPAARAGFSPWALAWDSHRNLYIADAFNCRIRKVDEAGIITTVAGNGTCGFSGDGGPATEASLFFPRDVAVGPDDVLYLADSENCRVRRVDAEGVIDTVAGTDDCDFSGDGGPATEAGVHAWGVAVASDGSVLVADRENCRLRQFVPGGTIATVAGTGDCGFSGDGGPAAQAMLNWPSDVFVAADDAIYLADTSNCRVRRINADGTITTVAGNGVCARGGDGGPATSAGVWHAMGLAIEEDGGFYYTELDTCRVRHVGADGIITTVANKAGICGTAGDGGPAAEARISDFPGGIELADDGSLYIAEGFNCQVRSIDPNGIVDTVAGTSHCGFSGDGGPAREAELDFVRDVALDASGVLYVAEPYNCRIRQIDLATGIIETVIGDGSCTYNGEGVPAEEAGVQPWGVAVGPDGALYLADAGNCRVRRVGADGLITTVAGGDQCGYAGDGGPATEAQLMRPEDIVLDQAGNLYTADLRNFTVRKVDTQGIISTIAGVGITRPVDAGGFDAKSGLFCNLESLGVPAPSYLGDGGPANEGGLYFPYAVALSDDGHLYIGDTFDHRVRRVTCGNSVPCAGPARAIAVFSPGYADQPAAAGGPADVLSPPNAGNPIGPEGSTIPIPGLLAGVGAILVLLGAALRLYNRRLREYYGGRRGGTS